MPANASPSGEIRPGLGGCRAARWLTLALTTACAQEGGSPGRSLALVVTGAEADLTAEAERTLMQDAAAVVGVALVPVSRLDEALGESAGVRAKACGRDLACLAGLGRAVSVEEVLIVRVLGGEGTVRLQVIGVDVGSGTLRRRLQIRSPSRAALAAAIESQRQALWTTTSPAPSATPDTSTSPLPVKVVARCSDVHGDVEVRRAGDEWQPLEEGDNLSIGELVRTASGATARIEYLSGNAVELVANTEIAIEPQAPTPGGGEAGDQVGVRRGVIRSVLNGPTATLKVRAGSGEAVDLGSSDGGAVSYRVGVQSTDTVEVAVASGVGRLVTAGGAVATVAAGRARDIRGGALVGETIVLPDFPRLSSPGVDATVMFIDDLRVSLRWKEVAEASGYRVQVASDQSFREMLVDEVLQTAARDFVPPRVGTYHWRVASQGAGGRASEFGFVRRLYVTPEEIRDLLLTPADGARLEFEPMTPRFVRVAWRAPVPPAPYVLVFSKNPDLSGEPVLRLVTGAQDVTTRELPPGDYYWGVYVERRSGRKPLFLQARRLSVTQGGPETP